MKFKLEITLGNDAMLSNRDISEALQRVAQKIKDKAADKEPTKIMDLNGNSVGFYKHS